MSRAESSSTLTSTKAILTYYPSSPSTADSHRRPFPPLFRSLGTPLASFNQATDRLSQYLLVAQLPGGGQPTNLIEPESRRNPSRSRRCARLLHHRHHHHWSIDSCRKSKTTASENTFPTALLSPTSFCPRQQVRPTRVLAGMLAATPRLYPTDCSHVMAP